MVSYMSLISESCGFRACLILSALFCIGFLRLKNVNNDWKERRKELDLNGIDIKN